MKTETMSIPEFMQRQRAKELGIADDGLFSFNRDRLEYICREIRKDKKMEKMVVTCGGSNFTPNTYMCLCSR